MKNKIYNIPATCSFVDELAQRFLKEYESREFELVDVVFLLPNKRACVSLKEAFLRIRGLEPLMLPRIVAIGDVEEDELFFIDSEVEVSTAIETLDRTLMFTKDIVAKSSKFGTTKLSLSQACFLAQELSRLIDVAIYEGLSFDNLNNLVPEEYAEHWLKTLDFLEIITKNFPKKLAELGLVNPSEKYNQLLNLKSKVWKEEKSEKRIVIAGGIASFPAIRNLVKTILSLKNGEFYINGLDKNIDDASWELLDCSHPFYEVKTLLDDLKVNRSEISDIVMAKNEHREKFISEIMRPAKTTNLWRELKSCHPIAYQGIFVVESENIREEAVSIALMMREVLEIPEKTAALVTTDRSLARRVSNELERWGVIVDDSAGMPLALTPVGLFFRLIAKVCTSNFEVVDFLGLLKHPFMANGMDKKEFRKLSRKYEYDYFRQREETKSQEVEDFIFSIKEKFSKLFELMNQENACLKDIIEEHINLAILFSTTDEIDGNNVLWKDEEGNQAAKFFGEIYEKAGILGEISKGEYLDFIESLMIGINIRKVYGTHPRLKILGPIEARLINFDRMIIGGFNEGVWPKVVASDPWMSRPMKKDFGFPLPEKSIGIMAKDFTDLLANEEVFITRSLRVQGTPMIKSRWLMRLETVLKAFNVSIDEVYDATYYNLAKSLDEVEKSEKISPSAPRPPVSMRPRKLSVSGIDALMKDPYIVFAKYILKLYPLESLIKDPTAADYGNIIHDILDEFNNNHINNFPENAKEELLKIGKNKFEENEVLSKTRAFWWPKFEKTIDWLVEIETKYRKDIIKIHNEISGSMTINSGAGKFVITAKADRIDETKDGKINVIDYKTGRAHSINEMKAGYAPQLPTIALIAKYGGYEGLSGSEVSKLLYWRLANKEIVFKDNLEEILEMTLKNISELISMFDFETTAYISKPHYKYGSLNKDYEHLSRNKEWE